MRSQMRNAKHEMRNRWKPVVRCPIPYTRYPTPRAFTLVEVLLAVFILGVGLTMVACIFPVAADWTRQNQEESLAVNVARNARAIILAKYQLSDLSGLAAVSSGTSTLVALPDMTNVAVGAAPARLPLIERAYAFGTATPYPASSLANAQSALYFWTALIRRTPDTSLNTKPNRFDLYIFVFKKGDAVQTFTQPATFIAGSRDTTSTSVDGTLVPLLATTTTVGGVPLGSIGVGMTSGTVFRSLPGGLANPTFIPLAVPSAETIAYAPAADAVSGTANASLTAVSPLVYVYQTTIAY